MKKYLTGVTVKVNFLSQVKVKTLNSFSAIVTIKLCSC